MLTRFIDLLKVSHMAVFFYYLTLPRIIAKFKNAVIDGLCNVFWHSSQNWYFPVYYESATQAAFHLGEVIL